MVGRPSVRLSVRPVDNTAFRSAARQDIAARRACSRRRRSAANAGSVVIYFIWRVLQSL